MISPCYALQVVFIDQSDHLGPRLSKLLVHPAFLIISSLLSFYLQPLPDNASFAQKDFHQQFFGSIFLRLQKYPKFFELSGPQWKWLLTATEVSDCMLFLRAFLTFALL